MVGAELGMLSSTSAGRWRDDQNLPGAGLRPVRLAGAYLRFTVGGGAFRFE